MDKKRYFEGLRTPNGFLVLKNGKWIDPDYIEAMEELNKEFPGIIYGKQISWSEQISRSTDE